ncbi:MAG: hypothetical protein NTZ49_02135 [Candidatus Parcubacteria bacterium]|nr:hypothetical protein [Candidatus Parcubacteria bacterium]
MDKKYWGQKATSFLRSTWVIYAFLAYTVVVTIMFIKYDNPNKLLFEPRYDYHYGAIRLGTLNQAIEMALKEPYLPITGSITGDYHMMDAEIDFYLPKPTTYYGQPLHLALFKSQKIMFDQADLQASPKYQKMDYNFPEFRNKKVAGFQASLGGTVDLDDGFATVKDHSRLKLHADYPKFEPECTDRPDWELKFQEGVLQLLGPESKELKAMRFSHLVVDSCQKTVMMELPKSVYAELQAKNQLTALQREFADKFKKSFPGTPLGVLDWSYDMMNSVSHWQEDQDINVAVAKVLKAQESMINGVSYTFMGYRQMHQKYLTKAFSLLLIWLALVSCVIMHFQLIGREGIKAELKKMVLTPWLIPIDLAVFLARGYRQARLNFQESRERRLVEKAKAIKLAEKAEAEAKFRRELQGQVLQESLERQKTEAEEAKALEARLETEAQEFLARYKSMDPDLILNHPGVDNGMAKRLKSAWLALEKIPANESIMDNPVNLELFNCFKHCLGAAQSKIDACQSMVSNLQGKLQKINTLDPVIRSRFTAETREILRQQAEILQTPRLKPRDLRLVEHAISKIIESHALPV